MVIANTNNHIAPYWGEEPSMAAGLNQLGIRNVSEQLFTILLSGLNNVSLRIRYYSFYCWIIKQFYEGKETIIDKDFNPFIRRSELLVAFINATLEDRSGVPGINFAAAKVDNGDDTLSLKDGADIGQGKSTYWANHGGVLRQYYVASLEELGLIGQNEKYPSIYNITKEEGYVNGLTLANKFAETIGEKRNQFLEIIQRGYVSIEELKSLNRAFGMKYLNADNDERASLQQMLMQQDNPLHPGSSNHRRKTIKYILEYLSSTPCQLKAIGFSRYMYEHYSTEDGLTAWGWYAYYLDNNWQYQLTQIFHDILAALKVAERQWVAVDDITAEMTEKVAASFHIDDKKTLIELISILKDDKIDFSAAEAIRNLLTYYRKNESKLSESESRYQEIGIRAENFCDFTKLVNKSAEIKAIDFIKRLIEDIIYRHYRVSFRKMLQTQKATQKFAFENGSLRFIDDWDATNTSPRIDTMRNFLLDLNIIEVKDGIDVLTEIGVKLLTELQNGDTTA